MNIVNYIHLAGKLPAVEPRNYKNEPVDDKLREAVREVITDVLKDKNKNMCVYGSYARYLQNNRHGAYNDIDILHKFGVNERNRVIKSIIGRLAAKKYNCVTYDINFLYHTISIRLKGTSTALIDLMYCERKAYDKFMKCGVDGITLLDPVIHSLQIIRSLAYDYKRYKYKGLSPAYIYTNIVKGIWLPSDHTRPTTKPLHDRSDTADKLAEKLLVTLARFKPIPCVTHNINLIVLNQVLTTEHGLLVDIIEDTGVRGEVCVTAPISNIVNETIFVVTLYAGGKIYIMSLTGPNLQRTTAGELHPIVVGGQLAALAVHNLYHKECTHVLTREIDWQCSRITKFGYSCEHTTTAYNSKYGKYDGASYTRILNSIQDQQCT